MAKRTSSSDPYTKEDVDFINSQFMRMANQKSRFCASVAAIVRMISSASDKEDFNSEMQFYGRIAQEIIDGNTDSVSTEEREAFLILHLAFIEVYKSLSKQ